MNLDGSCVASQRGALEPDVDIERVHRPGLAVAVRAWPARGVEGGAVSTEAGLEAVLVGEGDENGELGVEIETHETSQSWS